MSDRDLLQQALYVFDLFYESGFDREDCFAVIKALRERLAQPQRTHWEGCEEVHPECRKPEQEPVACPYCKSSATLGAVYYDQNCVGCVKRMTSPPQRTWVGLTDEEIDKTYETKVWDARRSFARAIEAKLKERNT